MNQSSIQTEPGNATRKRVRWFPWALGALLLLSVVALLQFLLRHRLAAENPLEGDSELAISGLADVLNNTPREKRVPLLRKCVQNLNPGLRYAAVDALGDAGDPSAADDIEHAFTDSASTVRQRALETLPKLDSERGFHLLLAGLRDEDTWIREAAITQLTQYARHSPAAAQRTIPMLIAALDDPGDLVPATAMNLLKKITGQTWLVKTKAPPVERQAAIRKWKDWWEQERSHYAISAEYADIPPIRPTRADPAPNFRLTDLEGRTVSLDGQRGRVTLLNFWGTWCPPCQMEIPDLVKLDSAYRRRGLDILGVALGEQEGAEGLRRWCKSHGVEYSQALSTQIVLDAYGHIEEVPVSVLIDKQGRIRYRWEGERDLMTFRSAVERLLQEPSP